MTSDEIRERFLTFFAERDHRRLASGSLIPASYDPSVLLTTAGMHPLKAYFAGDEQPPHHRLTSCQKCFRTPDIEVVGTTTRHLTFFEMLGNFSLGDYFKAGAVELAWELSLEGFGFKPEDIWVTVFEGDEELGLGLDEEAVEAWLAVGVPRERIVPLPALGELLAGGADRAVRPVLGALPRPRRPVGQARRPARRRERALPRVLEPRLHAVRPEPGRDAHAAAGPEHRHRPRPQPDGADPAGDRLDLRDRPVPAADPARRGALGPHATARTSTPIARCGSSRTTRAGCRSSSRTASCRRTRTAATCSGASCAARCCRAGGSGSRARSSPASRPSCAS